MIKVGDEVRAIDRGGAYDCDIDIVCDFQRENPFPPHEKMQSS